MLNLWDIFFKDKVIEIFTSSKEILDIGGGLRINKDKNNRLDKSRLWINDYLTGVDYKIMDCVDTYKPDIVGDIHNLPFSDSSLDAIICLAVLEHVEDPFKAISEIFRTLKPGGKCLLYVPFLFYYHAASGYYKDYWRFTFDGVEELTKNFSQREMSFVRGRFETWIYLSPLGRINYINKLAGIIDQLLSNKLSKQTSGYYVFLTK